MRSLVSTSGAVPEPTREEIARRASGQDPDGFWLHVEEPGEEDYRLLLEVFHFHPLTVEDVRHQNQRPKLEEYPGYWFAVLFGAAWEAADLRFDEYHLYLMGRGLVSVTKAGAPELRDLRERLRETPGLSKGRPAFLHYLVIDGLVDVMFPTLERLDQVIDELSDRIVSSPTHDDLAQISDMRHQVSDLRRILGAQRDVFQRLVSHSLDARDPELALYFRDVQDHIVRQYETVDSLRDLLTGAMDVYLSTVSNRLNGTMKQLTVIASLFLPLTFLTGFFGMNFGFLVARIGSVVAFAIGMCAMAVTIGLQLLIFRRRGWL